MVRQLLRATVGWAAGMAGVAAVWGGGALLVWWAFFRSDNEVAVPSPYAGWIPDCPAELTRVAPVAYGLNPKGTFYRDSHVVSETRRTCQSTDRRERSYTIVLEFSSQPDAVAYLASYVNTFGFPSRYKVWTPSQRIDQITRRSFDSSLAECGEEGKANYADCTVSDGIFVRLGVLVLEVQSEAPGHIFVPPSVNCGTPPKNPKYDRLWEQCMDFAALGPQVEGDAHPSRNQDLMAEMLRRAEQ